MVWNMHSADDDAAMRTAKAAADQLKEELEAKAAAEEASKTAAANDLLYMAAKESHAKDLNDISASVKNLSLEEIRDILKNGNIKNDHQLAAALREKEEQDKATGKNGRAAGTNESASTTGGNNEDDTRNQSRVAPEAAPLSPEDRQAVTPIQSGIGLRTSDINGDPNAHQGGLTQNGGQRKQLETQALDLTMSAQDKGDSIAADRLRQIIATNGTKDDIKIAMAQLANAEQAHDKDFISRNGKKEIQVINDGTGTPDIIVSNTGDSSDLSASAPTAGDSIGNMMGSLMGGGRGGRRHGGMEGPLSTLIGAIALVEGGPAAGMMISGGMEASHADPFKLPRPLEAALDIAAPDRGQSMQRTFTA